MGEVVRPHGVRGAIRVRPFDPEAPNLQPGCRVWAGDRSFEVRSSQPAGKSWVVTLEGVSSRTEAEGLRGALLEVPDTDLRRSSEDSYFVFELIGLRVVTDEGKEVGAIVDVLATGANDVYVVRSTDERELLLPALGELVREIDLEAKVVRITPLPGLFDDSP